jgi:hypothetical protein
VQARHWRECRERESSVLSQSVIILTGLKINVCPKQTSSVLMTPQVCKQVSYLNVVFVLCVLSCRFYDDAI